MRILRNTRTPDSLPAIEWFVFGDDLYAIEADRDYKSRKLPDAVKAIVEAKTLAAKSARKEARLQEAFARRQEKKANDEFAAFVSTDPEAIAIVEDEDEDAAPVAP